MTTVSTPAPSAHDTAAPAIAFDPSNPAHQRAWESILNMGRFEADRPAREARRTEELNSRAIERFDEALALYTEARVTLITQPPAENDEDEKEENRLIDALTAAGEYVMAFDAPDWRCVLAKLEIASRDSSDLAPAHLGSIIADIMRLGALDRSPTFLPLEWLNRFDRVGGKTTLIAHDAEGLAPVLGAPTGNERANTMLRDLEDYERNAIGEHLLKNLDPADYGLTVEAAR